MSLEDALKEGRFDEARSLLDDLARALDTGGRRTAAGDATSDGTGAPAATPEPDGDVGVALAMAWFPAGEYERAIERWESIADKWAGVPHSDYCRRMEGHIKWLRVHGVDVRAVTPIVVAEFIAWCEDRGEDPEGARAPYAADRHRLGGGVDWPPGRNDPCWCGSETKYKKCCGQARAVPIKSAA